jgi:hypothetical protein
MASAAYFKEKSKPPPLNYGALKQLKEQVETEAAAAGSSNDALVASILEQVGPSTV